MLRFSSILIFILLLSFCVTQTPAKDDKQIQTRKKASFDAKRIELEQEAKSIVKKFQRELKSRLKRALKSEGLIKAIEVCSTQAPEVARTLSEETDWRIRRVSLRARNRRTAIPDSWEKEVLKQFDERRANGEAAYKITFSEINGNNFRFMKAQSVQPLCLKCHGKNLSPSVDKALRKYYPQDKARGYSLGEIRGAFSLIKKQ